MINSALWAGKNVLVTGHTGFKGGWLTVWLKMLGANVSGYALNPPTSPNLYEVAGLATLMDREARADLADLNALKGFISESEPEVVFHLAAQPLVRESYRDPIGTLMSNTIGTAHVLEAVRGCPSVRAMVIVMTDKVYQNFESDAAYRENDPLGGYDLYSASKAAAELITAAYRSSFFSGRENSTVRIATARAGNVIGGGDWAQDRLVPDCLRAFARGEPVVLRSPDAVRPWQHVLEPLSGYLQLAGQLLSPGAEQFEQAWNFGPENSDNLTVREVADRLAVHFGGQVISNGSDGEPHEARDLRLDSTKARQQLGWGNRWPIGRALEMTAAWHKCFLSGRDPLRLCRQQITEHQNGVGGAASL